jgi:hypothetical protein
MAGSAAGESTGKEPKCELAIDISQINDPAKWPECCIYEVPNKLCKVNGEAHTPS